MDASNLFRAITFAADKHRGQRRKDSDSSPYINHPLAVASILVVEGTVSDEPTLIAAILHDTVEDTQTTFGELEQMFGAEVKSLVAELTDDKSLPKQTRKDLQIENAASKSQKAKMIIIADKICNLQDLIKAPPAEWSLERKRDYAIWSKKVVNQCFGVNLKLDSLFREVSESVLKL